MNTAMRLATVFAAGAAAMYYLDPQTGRRRRAKVREKSLAAGQDLTNLARAKSKQAIDHARGAAARTRSQLAHELVVDDDVLRERIRSKLGHLVDQPLQVEVSDGRVALSGDLSNAAFDELIAVVQPMHGVVHVESRLMTKPQSDDATLSHGARH
jgi:osmotically-inducible protein OsmY